MTLLVIWIIEMSKTNPIKIFDKPFVEIGKVKTNLNIFY